MYKKLWAPLAVTGSSNPPLDIEEVLSTGDRLACRFAASGVHQGLFLGFPATGGPCQYPGITMMHFVGLRVVERWSIVDRLSPLIQIGAVVAPKNSLRLDQAPTD